MANLTPAYYRALEECKRHHARSKTFSGKFLRPHAPFIKAIIDRLGCKSVLDYGSGKGYQYLAKRAHDAWGGILPHCYDPGVRQLAELPTGTFDGLICVDMLEHLEEQDVEPTLDAMFALLQPSGRRAYKGFAYISVGTKPARKTLPDGRNAHLTVRPLEWWSDKIKPRAKPRVLVQIVEAIEGP